MGLRSISQAALRVLAESTATDPAAKGRLSSRESDLPREIESIISARGERSCENGWSYLTPLRDKVGPRSPPELRTTKGRKTGRGRASKTTTL